LPPACLPACLPQKALAWQSILSPEAEGALERMLAPCKYDLLYNPTSFLTWEQLAASYHEAADWILVGVRGACSCGYIN
jgi:hypothetical protein